MLQRAVCHILCSTLLTTALLFLPASSHSQSAETLDTPQLYDPQQAGQMLVVAFKDPSIHRMPSTASAYRQRGDYQSTSWSENLSTQIAEDYHLQKLTEWPMTAVDVHCVVYQVPRNVSMADTLQSLAKDARVDLVQNLNLFTTQAQQEADPYLKLQANLQTMQIAEVHSKTTGKNIAIAMIDTGVDVTHPDLAGQISRNENFAQGISAAFNSDKHGTAVAGIMVAKKANGKGIIGVAPDAHVLALKACWPDKTDAITAVCNSFTLALAINTAITSGAKILNMSLTGPKDALLELLLSKAIAAGMIVVAADTGSGKASESFPASMSQVLAIQALRSSSKTMPTLSDPLSAPSEKILTTFPFATYDFISGSSMATAEVSGIVALLLELKPDLTLTEIQTLLHQSSLSQHNTENLGINAHNALLALCAMSQCNQNTLNFAQQ